MSTVTKETHVADLVLEQPGRARVFERFGIDYCCGGRVPLEEACAERDLDVDVVIDALAQAAPAEVAEVDWRDASLRDLSAHIVEHHHGYLREELPPLHELVDKVVRAHGQDHPELADVQTTFAVVESELVQHMAKEEHVLFPACVALEDGTAAGFPFGSVENPIGMMVHEHEEVAAGLSRIRTLTGDYTPPQGACNSYRAMLDRLATLEQDTHEHVHKENNILFPRAVALESAA